MLTLGKKYKDKITGFEGIAYGRSTYLTGCDQYCLIPGVDKDGKPQESLRFDEGRLMEVGVGITGEKVQTKKMGGPNMYNPNVN